jgi:uncharacterized protein (TIGR02145 family)
MDWTTLTTYLGGVRTAGTVMKKNDALWSTNIGTNTSGFSALPGGFRNDVGLFNDARATTTFWSATEVGSVSALGRSLPSNNSQVFRTNNNKSLGASVRCLRD